MYRIGELAKKANVSKRTIDYYTQIGLLQVETISSSNYRLYSDKTIEDIHFIELCKAMNLSLQDIKERIELRQSEKLNHRKFETCLKHAKLLETHMKQLETEIQELNPIFEQLNDDSKNKISQQISGQSKKLVLALSLLLK